VPVPRGLSDDENIVSLNSNTRYMQYCRSDVVPDPNFEL
jgi:hypothetical protein